MCRYARLSICIYITLGIKVVRDTVEIKKLEDYKRGEVGVYEE